MNDKQALDQLKTITAMLDSIYSLMTAGVPYAAFHDAIAELNKLQAVCIKQIIEEVVETVDE